MTKIRLLERIPVEKKHGMYKGRIVPVETVANLPGPSRHRVFWWVVGDTGERVGILGREAEEVSEEGEGDEDGTASRTVH